MLLDLHQLRHAVTRRGGGPPLPAPTDADIAALLTPLQRRVRRLLTRHGRLSEDAEATDPCAAQAPLFARAGAAALQSRVARARGPGSRAGASPPRWPRPTLHRAARAWRASAFTPTWRGPRLAGLGEFPTDEELLAAVRALPS